MDAISFLFICLALVASRASSDVCNIPSLLGAPDKLEEPSSDEEYMFLVEIECKPNKLDIHWHLTADADPSGYHVSLNYVCTNRNGGIIHLSESIFKVHNDDMLNTTSAPIQELINDGATCTAYGCHHSIRDRRLLLLNKNVSCTYNLSDEVSTIPVQTTSWVAPINTLDFASTSTNEEVIPSSTATYSPSSITPAYTFPTSSPNGLSTVATDLSTSVPHTPSPSPVAVANNGIRNSKFLLFTPVIAIAGFIAVIISVAIVVSKKKAVQNDLRFKHLGATLNIEKIDPYYTPVQVESNIQKCESIGSIFEYLSAHKADESNESPEPFVPSATNYSVISQQSQDPPHSLDLQVEVAYSSPYALQPPPPKSKHCVFDITQRESLNSRGYQSYATSLPQLVDIPMTTKQYQYHFERKEQDIAVGAAQDEETLTSSISSFSDSEQEDYIDVLTDSYEDSESKANTVNDVVLSFSSSLSSDVTLHEDVDYTACSHVTKTLSQESLPELNLTINPHHFDPL